MEIITAITTALSTLKTGYEIKKLAGNLDSEVQQSELRIEIRKLQESLIEIHEVLLNAKKEILENRELLQVKDEEIKRLYSLLEAKTSSHEVDMPEECIKILDLLGKVSNAETSQQIAHYLEVPEQRAKYFLDILDKNNLLHTSFSLRSGTYYGLNDKSRKILFEKGLL